MTVGKGFCGRPVGFSSRSFRYTDYVFLEVLYNSFFFFFFSSFVIRTLGVNIFLYINASMSIYMYVYGSI